GEGLVAVAELAVAVAPTVEGIGVVRLGGEDLLEQRNGAAVILRLDPALGLDVVVAGAGCARRAVVSAAVTAAAHGDHADAAEEEWQRRDCGECGSPSHPRSPMAVEPRFPTGNNTAVPVPIPPVPRVEDRPRR